MSHTSRTWIQRFSSPRLRDGRPPRAASRALRSRRPELERLEGRALLSVTIAPTNNNGQGYTGLDFNHSGGYVPPDTCGAAGPSSYVETVNQTLAIYSPKSTGATAVTNSFSNFWYTQGGLAKTDSGSFLSDPIVTYDNLIGKFIVGDQDVDSTTLVSNFDFAVSKTNNPATLTSADWNFYQISTTETGFDADYPGNFGFNHDAFVFALNMFGPGNHVLVTSVNASDLASGVSQSQLHFFKNDLADFSVRPTTMHDSVANDPMWLVTEHGDGHSIDVIKMGGVLSNSATFNYTNLAVNSYSGLVVPLNPNGTGITNNIDSRILKAAEANNTIVATHSVSVSSTQDDARWYSIDVSSGTPTLIDQGDVSAGNNTYLYYPAIDINPAGNFGMTYMRSGTDSSTDFMSMYVTGRTPSDAKGTMEASVIVPAGAGQANYHDFTGTGRAGDLSGINVDPSDGSFWAANEFANTEATANWGTAIANFTVASTTTSADLSVTNSGPSSVTAGTNATYTITVTNNGPDPAQNVVLTDTLPTGSVFVSMSPGVGNPDSYTFSQSAGTVTESTATVASGSSDTFTLVVSAPANLSNGADFSDTASVSSSTTDPNSSNNTAKVTGSIVNNTQSADLAVANSGPTTSIEGNTVTYTVTVTNNGPTDAAVTVLTNTLGTNLIFVSATTSQGTFTQSGGVVTFSLGTVANGKSATATITAQSIEDGSPTDSSSASSSIPDPNTSNNSPLPVTTVVTEDTITVSGPITTKAHSVNNQTVATFSHASGVEATSAFSATINWGDNTTSAGIVVQNGNSYSVQGSHTYSKKGGRHTITTTVIEVGSSPNFDDAGNGSFAALFDQQPTGAPSALDLSSLAMFGPSSTPSLATAGTGILASPAAGAPSGQSDLSGAASSTDGTAVNLGTGILDVYVSPPTGQTLDLQSNLVGASGKRKAALVE